MSNLINTIRRISEDSRELPFSIYNSVKEQNLLNVPVVKPLLIVVLSGYKELEEDKKISCRSGDFIFLSDSPTINMRNIPNKEEYFALLVEFETEDFEGFKINTTYEKKYCLGKVTFELKSCLKQFIEMSAWADTELLSLRKKEIIKLLCQMGHQEIISIATNHKITHRLHSLFSNKLEEELTMQSICTQLAMSESTLRRKLKNEGSTVQEIRDQVKLGLGLHLLQTTLDPIGIISEKCGYLSQSRFSERFKERFGLTPSALRKTR